MLRFKITLALAASLALLSGCASGPRSPTGTGLAWVPRAKINVVSHRRFVHRVGFAPMATRPAKPAIAALAAFLAKNRVRPDDVITLEGGTARERLSVARALARLGLPGAGEARFAPVLSTQMVLVVVDRYLATPPRDCPDWSKPVSAGFTNTVDSNYGCATAYDLGQMVADPHDLLRGRTLGPADAADGVNGITAYRKGDVRLGGQTSAGGGLTMPQQPLPSPGGSGTP